MSTARARAAWGALGVLALVLSCSTVEKVKLDPTLGTAEEAVHPLGRKLRVAVVAPELPAPPAAVAPGGGGDAPPAAPPAPPALPGTVVEFTGRYSEEYPSLAHMESAVPAALREAGFELVPVKSLHEARRSNAAMILELLPPEVEGFRNASGLGITLEGAVMDVHVLYRARASTPAGHKLGTFSGHGESSTHFVFVEPHVETAATGLVSLGLTAAVTTVLGVPAALAFAWVATLKKGDIGLCMSNRIPERENVDGKNMSPGICTDMVKLLAQAALVGGVLAAASGTMTLSQFTATKVFGGVTSLIKNRVTGPQWEGMLKNAHDRAARALAQSAVLNVGRLERLPTLPQAWAPAAGAQDG